MSRVRTGIPPEPSEQAASAPPAAGGNVSLGPLAQSVLNRLMTDAQSYGVPLQRNAVLDYSSLNRAVLEVGDAVKRQTSPAAHREWVEQYSKLGFGSKPGPVANGKTAESVFGTVAPSQAKSAPDSGAGSQASSKAAPANGAAAHDASARADSAAAPEIVSARGSEITVEVRCKGRSGSVVRTCGVIIGAVPSKMDAAKLVYAILIPSDTVLHLLDGANQATRAKLIVKFANRQFAPGRIRYIAKSKDQPGLALIWSIAGKQPVATFPAPESAAKHEAGESLFLCSSASRSKEPVRPRGKYRLGLTAAKVKARLDPGDFRSSGSRKRQPYVLRVETTGQHSDAARRESALVGGGPVLNMRGEVVGLSPFEQVGESAVLYSLPTLLACIKSGVRSGQGSRGAPAASRTASNR